MPKRVSVFGGDMHRSGERFVEAMSRYTNDEYTMRLYADVAVVIKRGEVRCFYLSDGGDIALTDLVYLRGITDEHLRHALAAYLGHKGVPVINSESNHFQCMSKLEQYVVFALAGIPVPDSVFVSRAEHYRRAVELLECEFPIVAKSITGSNGRQNVLIKSVGELKDLKIDQPIFQAFIPNSFDYRVIVAGDKVALAYRRTRQTGTGEHRNNLARGGRREIATLPEELQKMAVEAARIVGRELSGLDIVTNSETGHSVVLEANFNFASLIFGDGEASIEADYYRLLAEYFNRLTR